MECGRARRCGIDESLKKTTAVLSSFILSILPFLILWAAWSVLPDTIPAHWSGGVVDRWGNKLELLVVPLFSLIGSIAISVYLIVSTRRREFADFSARMRRDFVACYISSLLLSTTCSVIIAVWVQLILTQSTAVDGGLGLSILYSLPGLYVTGHAGVPGPLDLLPGHLVGHRHDSLPFALVLPHAAGSAYA